MSADLEEQSHYPGIREAKIDLKQLPGHLTGTGSAVADIRKGLPSKVFVEVAKRVGLGRDDLAKKLGLKPRTISSRLDSPGKRLNPNETERVLRIRQIFEQAIRVFGSEEQARQWLMSPARGLEGQRPIDLMDTGPGGGQVREYLGAIEHGNFW